MSCLPLQRSFLQLLCWISPLMARHQFTRIGTQPLSCNFQKLVQVFWAYLPTVTSCVHLETNWIIYVLMQPSSVHQTEMPAILAKWRLCALKKCVMPVFCCPQEIEEKAPIMRAQREDYEQALRAVTQLTQQLDSAMTVSLSRLLCWFKTLGIYNGKWYVCAIYCTKSNV